MKRIKLFLSFGALCANLVSSSLLPQEDPVSSKKFHINYVSNEEWQGILGDNNGSIVDFGHDMKCYIPNEKKMNVYQEMSQNSTKWQIWLNETLNKGIDILDKTLSDKCVRYSGGFWKYQFCYGKDIKQYHDDPDAKNMVNLLGYVEPKKDRHEDIGLLYENDVGYYISEFLEAGDICEVNGQKRLVEIQYICGINNNIPLLQWVREIKMCQYEAVVIVPQLCQLELFAKNEDKLSANQIACVKKSNTYQNNIVNLISDFEPSFVGNGIYFLNPIRKNEKTLLLYTGDINVPLVSKENEQKLYQNIGKAFNRIISKQLLQIPADGSEKGKTIIESGDVFQWFSPVIDLYANYLFTLHVNMHYDGKAEIFINTQDDLYYEKNNFILFQKGNGIRSGKEGQAEKVIKKNKHVDVKLENGDNIELNVRPQQDSNILLIDIVDEGGNEISLDEQAKNEILKTLLDHQDIQEILNELSDQNSEESVVEYVPFDESSFNRDHLGQPEESDSLEQNTEGNNDMRKKNEEKITTRIYSVEETLLEVNNFKPQSTYDGDSSISSELLGNENRDKSSDILPQSERTKSDEDTDLESLTDKENKIDLEKGENPIIKPAEGSSSDREIRTVEGEDPREILATTSTWHLNDDSVSVHVAEKTITNFMNKIVTDTELVNSNEKNDVVSSNIPEEINSEHLLNKESKNKYTNNKIDGELVSKTLIEETTKETPSYTVSDKEYEQNVEISHDEL